MTETKVDVLELVIEFMYNGEVFVKTAILEEFMALAEKLKIRGLRKVNENSESVAPSLATLVGFGHVVRRRETRSATPPMVVMKIEEPEALVPPPVKRAKPGGTTSRLVLILNFRVEFQLM
jgi:hypothetical protein